MMQTAVVFSKWENISEFKKLKKNVETHLQDIHDFHFLLSIKKKQLKEVENLKEVFFVLKKDFSMFGELKNQRIKKLLKQEKDKVLIVALKENSFFLKRIMKNCRLFSIGMDSEKLPPFNFSIKNSDLKNGIFFKHINKYINKIQF